MALGGGVFTNQNKILPGAYINFVSALSSTASVSERGVAAVAIPMDWGAEGELFSLSKSEFLMNAKLYFGYDYSHKKLKGLRDLFINLNKCFFYRLNGGTKASNSYAEAKFSGVCGNKIYITIDKNIFDSTKYDVSTYFDGQMADLQTVSSSSELLDNSFVVFKDFQMSDSNVVSSLSGGESSEDFIENAHSNFLNALQSVSFNTLCCLSDSSDIQNLYIEFTKNMRDMYGIKFQTVLFNSEAPNYIGIINLKTAVLDKEASGNELLFWTAGALSGANISESLTNKVYDGEFIPNVNYSQEELAESIKNGFFCFHRVGSDIRVLADINSFTDFSEKMNEDFSYNQIIRIIDSAAKDLAFIFSSKYLGKVQNNKSGRISFWNEVVTYNRTLEKMGVIEDFSSDEVTVEEGDSKDSVIVSNPIKIVSAMSKLYMSIVVI